MKGWLDKYGNNINANEGTSSAPEGWVGEGYSTKGRNYSPAWGGQFEDGGNIYPVSYIPQAQKGLSSTDKKLKELGSDAYSAMAPFYQTVFEAGNKYANPETGITSPLNSLRATVKGLIKHPEVIFMKRYNIPSNLTDENHNPYGVEGYRTPLSTGTKPWFPTQWAEPRKEHHGLGDWFERMRTRHKENKAERKGRRDRGRTDCWGANCYENKTPTAAMGGSLPGSVGFTYARTNSPAPSEGPYAKKTLPSAQKGKEIPYHPITNPEGYHLQNTLDKIKKLSNKEKRYEPSDAVKNLKSTLSVASLAGAGNPLTQYLAQVAGGTGDLYTAARYAADKNWNKAGEDFVQGALGFIPYAKAIPGMKIGTDYFTKGARLFNRILKTGHNASDIKTLTESPTSSYPVQENGGMTYYQNGLDWKPRNISRDGSEVPKNQNAQFVLPKYTMPRAGSDNTAIGITSLQRNPELERQIDVAKKIAKQPQIKQGRKSTPAEEAERKRKNIIYASQQPNAQIDEQGNVSRVNPNRSVTGEAENFMSRREDQKGEDALTALEIAGYLEGAGALGSVAKKAVAKSMESGLLSNTYKLNPWAFKANPEAYYRMLGKEGYADALESGIIRANPKNIHPFSGEPIYDRPYFSKGIPFDRDWKSPFINKKGKQTIGSIYPDETMVEVFGHNKFHPTNDLVTSPVNTLHSLEDGVNFYKRDWLRGYKEVPKKEEGGIIKDDMGYWNPDNWGKVVEIDSPDITMKNVEYGPLLGISKQTGERKVMLPGKDYTFANTKQVIEKPLNKKSTGGWLDKYN